MEKDTTLAKDGYRLLADSLQEYGFIVYDPAGNVVTANKGAQEMYRTKSTIEGEHFSAFYSNTDVQAGMPTEQLKVAEELGKFDGEGWRMRKDGSKFWAGVTITPLRNENGTLIGFGERVRDLSSTLTGEEETSRLNEMQASLLKSRSEVLDYKHALDESSIVAITDQKGIIKHVNDNFCKISKYSREELIGQDHRIINSNYHGKDFIRNLWVTIANGRIWRGELRNRAKDGTVYWVDTTIVPFLNDKGKPYQYLAIRSDISGRKAAEEQLQKVNELLENKVRERTFELTQALEREKQLSDMKSQFVSTASHEFRTPLSAILSSISLIEHYADAAQLEKRNRHIERIKSSVRNLTSILDDFLSLEKLEQGRVHTLTEDFNLKEFVADVIEDVEGLAKKKQQQIVFEFSGNPEVHQDKKILKNILLNLLTNAIKYSGEEKRIKVRVVAGSKEATLSVADKGIGIPADAQENLFGRFFRARNAINIQGIGLGLHIVKRYIELIEGTIGFESKENQGTTFTISLPVGKEVDKR